MKRYLFLLMTVSLVGCNNFIPEVSHISLGVPQSPAEKPQSLPQPPTPIANSPQTETTAPLSPPQPIPASFIPLNPVVQPQQTTIAPIAPKAPIVNARTNILHQLLLKEERIKELLTLKALELILYSPEPLSSQRDIPNPWFKNTTNHPFLETTPSFLKELIPIESNLLQNLSINSQVNEITTILNDSPKGKYPGTLIEDTYIVTPNTPPSTNTNTQLSYQNGALDQLNIKFLGQEVKKLAIGAGEASHNIWLGSEKNQHGIELWNTPPLLHNQFRLIDSWSAQNLNAVAQLENSSAQYVSFNEKLKQKFQASASIALILEYFEDLKTVAQAAQNIRKNNPAQAQAISDSTLSQSAVQLLSKSLNKVELGNETQPTRINYEFLPISPEVLSDQAQLDLNFISFSMDFPGIADIFKSTKLNLQLKANCKTINFRTRGQIVLILKEFDNITTAIRELTQLANVWNNQTAIENDDTATLGTICQKTPFCLDLNPAENQFRLLYSYLIDSQSQIPYNSLLNRSLGIFSAHPERSLITCLNNGEPPSNPTPSVLPSVEPQAPLPEPSSSPSSTPIPSSSPSQGESPDPSPSGSPAASPSAPTPSHTITFNGNFFSPPTRTINVGERVNWENTTNQFHLLKSAENLFSIQLLAANGAFSFTFTQAGTYKFTIGLKQVIITVI